MIDIENLIKVESKNISESFSKIYSNGIIKQFDFVIDEKRFNSRYSDSVNITLEGDFASMFQQLQDFTDYPAVYYFKINPLIEKKEIESLMKELEVNVPARNKVSTNKGILYVGKVKSCAWGRLIQHLGYHKQKKSHGLYISRWADKTSLELKLSYTVLFLDPSVADYMNILEQKLANTLEPIIGKH